MRSLAIPAILPIFLFGPGGSLAGQVGTSGAADVPQNMALESTASQRVLPAVLLPELAPSIDGILAEGEWSGAPVATDFTQLEPQEGHPATEKTEVRVLYGPEALFVAFRMFDSRPDSIAAQLTRRDQLTYSDAVHLLIDSYYDRRTAFHFGVNPVGVKVDLYRFDDTNDDASWDAVWDVATRIDEEGWTAEFRIPYSQLRFGNHDDQTWGINFAREVARKNETSTWAPLRQSDAAIVSKFGELQGLKGLGSPSRLELRPFTVARVDQAPEEEANPFYRQNDFYSSAGLDLKYGVTNDLTLDVTMNPDFGQVEADPAQVNLTAFETFYPEKRPFFIEGAAIYNFSIGVGDGDLGSESLFYSRRIGRAPTGHPDPQGGYVDTPQRTTIMGAWKVSGKTRGGWSVGLLHALTQEESAQIATGDGTRLEEAVEPLSNYGVARLQKDFRDGRSAFGLIGTMAKRDASVADGLELHSGAFAGGFDFRHRFGTEDGYQLDAFLLGTHVRGSEGAISRTQRSPARHFQRPDADHLDYDPTRTSLNGWAAKLDFSKVGGGYWRYGTMLRAKSPGFEPNDMGFQRESDLLLNVLFLGYNHHNPTKHLRSWNLNASEWQGWSFGGERLTTGLNVNGALTLPSYWGGYVGLNHDFEAFSNSSLRGGPLIRREAHSSGWVGLFSDSRTAIQANGRFNWSRASESGSWSAGTNLDLTWRLSGRASVGMGPFFNRSLNDLQWVQRVVASGDRYVFGRINQKTLGLTGRMDLTFKPDLTLQLYAQPFVSAGRYSDFKQVVDPLAERYRERIGLLETYRNDDRYTTDLDGDGSPESFRDPDFNVRQFQSTMVLRWEYKPGSLLYLVWSQGRNQYVRDGQFDARADLRDLFRQEAENIFMVKVSYWITP